MGFTKLDEEILKSSVMAADPFTFKVWITLLAACREDGIARLSRIYISSITHISIDQVETSLQILMSPDPYSRTKEHDGRRIEETEGGFLVFNYGKYREQTYSGSKEAERKREYRARKKRDILGQVPNVPDASASASASASAIDLEKEFAEFWEAYDYKVSKQDAFNAFKALRRSGVQKAEIARALNGYHDFLRMKKERDGFDQAKMYPGTFLRKNRWRDYLGIVYKAKL